MKQSQLVANVIGYIAGTGFVVVVTACRKRYWVKAAHKRAASRNIELPARIEPRVVRFLRQEYLIATLLALPLYTLIIASLGGTDRESYWADSYPWTVTALPVLMIFFSFLQTVRPRWKASGDTRVTHLGQLRFRDAFTRTEFIVLLAGLFVTALATTWGLWRLGATSWWWVVWLTVFVVSIAAGGRAAQAVMNRPSSASDAIELGWDDVFRFDRVRTVAIGAAWGPAFIIFLLDDQVAFQLGNKQTISFLPFYALLVGFIVLVQMFKQGRQLWRQSWSPPPDQATA